MALLCDGDGAVLRWLRDDFQLRPPASGPINFLRLLHESSHLKGLTLLAQVREGAALIDWELCFPVQDDLRVLRVAAAHGPGGTVILAANTEDEIDFLCRLVGSNAAECAQSCLQILSASTPSPNGASEAQVQQDFIRMYNDFARLQREHASQKAQLLRLSAEKDRIMNMAVHDLRSPLNVITLLAGSVSAEARERLSEREVSVLDQIVTTAKDMGRTLGDMLDNARHAPGAPELSLQSGDFGQLVRSRIALLAPLAACKDIELRWHCDAGPYATLFDVRHMQHVVDNLLGNAIKFSPSGTAIEVRLHPLQEGLQLDVCDQGPGIADADLDRIFEAYARGSAAATGGEASTGLGLAICRNIVEAHGGRVWAENRSSGGAVFRVHLPAGGASEFQRGGD